MNQPSRKVGMVAAPLPPSDVANRTSRRGRARRRTPGPTSPATPAPDGLPHRGDCRRPEPVRLAYASTRGWALVKCPTCGACRMERTSATDPDRSPAA